MSVAKSCTCCGQLTHTSLSSEKFISPQFSLMPLRPGTFTKKMTLNYAVPVGRIKFVLFDDRPDSPTRGEIQEIFMGPDNYVLVTVPPMVWNGFKGVGPDASLVANCASIPHDPDEIDRCDPADTRIPYDWALKHK